MKEPNYALGWLAYGVGVFFLAVGQGEWLHAFQVIGVGAIFIGLILGIRWMGE